MINIFRHVYILSKIEFLLFVKVQGYKDFLITINSAGKLKKGMDPFHSTLIFQCFKVEVMGSSVTLG